MKTVKNVEGVSIAMAPCPNCGGLRLRFAIEQQMRGILCELRIAVAGSLGRR